MSSVLPRPPLRRRRERPRGRDEVTCASCGINSGQERARIDLSSFIKAYDIRGRVADQLTPPVCRAVGAAFARVIAEPDGHSRVVLGHDMRESSPVLSEAFADGVRTSGLDVISIGLCATDELYYASGTVGAPGAMVTASHNPAAYNGIKLCRSEAVPLEMSTGLELVRDLAQWLLDRGEGHEWGTERGRGGLQQRDLLGDYAAYLHSLVDLSGIRALRVVVDAGNGMAGLTAPAALGLAPSVEMIGLYLDLDGTFPNHEANPLEPANLVDLQAAVLTHKADLGLAFDGDADRCFVVDERGEPVTASAIAALVASREIRRETEAGVSPGQVTIVHNSITSRAVPEAVLALGARPVVTKVGHSYVKATMATHDAVFGGEHSGHYYFRDFWRADTGMLAALHVLAALGTGPVDATMSSLAAPYQRYAHSGEINSVVTDVAGALERVRAWATSGDRDVRFAEFDGLAMSYETSTGDFWSVSVRLSNTEPLLRVNVEARHESTMFAVRDAVLEAIVGTVSV